jgi:hypothetical protein
MGKICKNCPYVTKAFLSFGFNYISSAPARSDLMIVQFSDTRPLFDLMQSVHFLLPNDQDQRYDVRSVIRSLLLEKLLKRA